MKRGAVDIAVIIPSTGRQTLFASLSSVFDQDLTPKEIVVVDDSKEQKIEFQPRTNLKLIKTGGGRGPSSARNLGIASTKSSIVAFLDDDDIWLKNHLSTSIEKMEEFDLDAIISSAITHKGVRPKKLLSGEKDPLIEVYGGIRYLNSPYYLPLPGLMVKREVTNHISFNERLRDREDLWFIHKIFEFGFRIQQSNSTTVKIHDNYSRKIFRSNLDANIKWFYRLMTIDRTAAKKFIKYIAIRNELLRANIRNVIKLLKLSSSVKSIHNPQLLIQD